jgi:acetyltransferase-like isoleucine patch superfamily enzyme
VHHDVRPHEFASFGARSRIDPPATVTARHCIHIGDDVVIMRRAWLSVFDTWKGAHYDTALRIGAGTRVGQECVLVCYGQMEIGERVLIADRVLIANTSHGYEDPDTAIMDQPVPDGRPVRIGDGAFIGLGAAVLAGVTVGERAVIAARAVVTKDVPPNCVAAGNPAQIIRHFDRAAGEWRNGAPSGE